MANHQIPTPSRRTAAATAPISHHRPGATRAAGRRRAVGGEAASAGDGRDRRRRCAFDVLAEQFGRHALERRQHDAMRCRRDRHHVAHADDHAAGAFGGRDAGRRVLDGDARQRIDAEVFGCTPVGLGMWLAVHHLIAGDHGLERAGRELADDLVGRLPPRHRHQRAGNAAQLQGGEQLACSRSPRHALAHEVGDCSGQLVDDLVRSQRHSTTGADHLGGVHQVEADDRHRVVVGPTPSVGRDELVLATDPVRLGVDQRAVHVPEDGRGYGGHLAGGSSTNSISVPKLPLGWMNATVVPRLPGRGAASIGVAPAAFIDSRAAAQSATR